MIEVGRSETIIKEMDQLASEKHTHVATRAEIDVYRGNWWIHSNVKGMYPAPHIHEHLAMAICVHPHAQHEQPGGHCEQWHGHHKAHCRVQCAVLSTPRTVC